MERHRARGWGWEWWAIAGLVLLLGGIASVRIYDVWRGHRDRKAAMAEAYRTIRVGQYSNEVEDMLGEPFDHLDPGDSLGYHYYWYNVEGYQILIQYDLNYRVKSKQIAERSWWRP
jgi:hypothetical protein